MTKFISGTLCYRITVVKSISEELNISFKNATVSLNIRQNSYLTDEPNEIKDQVKKAIFKYKNHPSTILIKKNNSTKTICFY